ncbi:putative solute carrier family 13 [Helianthus anomalus]
MLNIDAVTAVVLGLSALLITRVVTWKECLAEAVAWDTLTRFVVPYRIFVRVCLHISRC